MGKLHIGPKAAVQQAKAASVAAKVVEERIVERVIRIPVISIREVAPKWAKMLVFIAAVEAFVIIVLLNR